MGIALNILEFSTAVGCFSFAAGLLGALTGLGGGVIVVPVLALALGVDVRYAIGAALVSVIATSSGAASAYVKEGYTNLRIGMFLEVATTLGALLGAFLATMMPTADVAIVFGGVLLWSAYASTRTSRRASEAVSADPLARRLGFDARYPTAQGRRAYHVRSIPLGFLLMLVAGVLSGLLGIGSGAMKVVAMDQVMHVPFKVSTTTSNFMIGVTASASAGIYLNRGYIDPALAMPVVLGVLAGAMLGARVLVRVPITGLRRLFAVAIALLAVEMIYNAFTGKL